MEPAIEARLQNATVELPIRLSPTLGDSYAGETDSSYNNSGNRWVRMEIPTGEKQTAYVTTEGTVEREWRSLWERNRQRTQQQREQVSKNGDPYERETDSACNNRGNRWEWRYLRERNRQRCNNRGNRLVRMERETDKAHITEGNRLTRKKIPTREKEITHITTEGTG